MSVMVYFIVVATAHVVVGNYVTMGIEKVKAVERIQANKRVESATFSPAPNVTYAYEAGNFIELLLGFVADTYSTFSHRLKRVRKNKE